MLAGLHFSQAEDMVEGLAKPCRTDALFLCLQQTSVASRRPLGSSTLLRRLRKPTTQLP